MKKFNSKPISLKLLYLMEVYYWLGFFEDTEQEYKVDKNKLEIYDPLRSTFA